MVNHQDRIKGVQVEKAFFLALYPAELQAPDAGLAGFEPATTTC
jgi:hypothetical protein